MVFVYFIGHLQATARTYWLQEHRKAPGCRSHLSRSRCPGFSRSPTFQSYRRRCRGRRHSSRAFCQDCGARLRLHIGLSVLRLGCLSRKRIVIRPTLIVLLVLIFGVLRLPIENAITERDRVAYSHQVNLRLELREQIGQLGFIAALSGFRSLVADFAFIEAQTAWERTEWSLVLLCFQEATTLQPHSLLYWDMAAWHMAWNASAAALHERVLPTEFLRRRAQRQYIEMGKGFLARGIRNNPQRPVLYESLARLYRDKLEDHDSPRASFIRKRLRCLARRITTNALPLTSFPTRPAGNAKLGRSCGHSTTAGRTSASPLSSNA